MSGNPGETLKLRRPMVEELFARAREAAPEECCGLIGGRGAGAESVYPLRNAAPDARVAYEAAPEELFAAQRAMRGRGERLLAIYHSHPRSADPVPSAADVRLAFYPAAVYLIIGFDEKGRGVLGAFRIYEQEGRWERVGVETAG